MKALKIFGLILLCFLVAILESASAFAAPPDNFTARMVMGNMSMPMAKMGSKTRVENPMMQGMVTLSFGDTHKTLIYSTQTQTYTEMMQEDKTPSVYDSRAVIEKKKIGNEKIDGHPCVKYDAVVYLKDKPSEKYNTVLWEAQDLGGLVIRQEMTLPERQQPKGGGPAKMTTEFKDIKVGAASASMFEVPKGYKKVENMMEMMGGPAGQQKQIEEMMKKMKKQ